MRKLLTSAALAITLVQLQAQEAWQGILAIDPMRANGYFIIDPVKAANQEVAYMHVDIVIDKVLAGGGFQHTVVESFILRDNPYGHLNPALLSALREDESWHYELEGFSVQGTPVVTGSSFGGGPAWPEACRETCVSNQYAWALVAYSDGAQTFIEINNATEPTYGEYYYFFVPDNQWPTFKENHAPSDFGLNDGWEWSGYECSNNWQLMSLGGCGDPTITTQFDVIRVGSLPQGATGVNGGSIGANFSGQPGWAIRKDRGPWRGLHAWTENLAGPGGVCLNIRDHYNNDPLVIANRNSHSPAIPAVTCMSQSIFGGGVGWGGPYSVSDCWGTPLANYIDQSTGSSNVFGWVQDAMDCITEELSSFDLTAVHSISAHGFSVGAAEISFDVVLPTTDDAKLVPFPKTALPAGLYEFMIFMDDGRFLRRFEEFENGIVLEASFASFVDVSIYPVPVTGDRFSIDFDLLFATGVSVNVVNNMGLQYHHKILNFDLPGRNKYVVEMGSPWPAGIYHAVFTYTDGSSESKSFTVEE